MQEIYNMTNKVKVLDLGQLETHNNEYRYELVPTRNIYDDIQRTKKIEQYGADYINNDILLEAIILHECETVDHTGKPVIIDIEEMDNVVKAANEALDNKIKRPLNKIRRWIDGKTALTVDNVPIMKDHENKVDNTIGWSRGYLVRKQINGQQCVIMKALISDEFAKERIKNGFYKWVSPTIRNDYTIKELSFVNNPAGEYSGILSEPNIAPVVQYHNVQAPVIKMSEYEQLHMQFSENKLNADSLKNEIKLKEEEHKSVKNKIFIKRNLTKLMKTGRILPRDAVIYEQMLQNMSSVKDIELAIDGLMLSEPLIPLDEMYNENYNVGVLGEVIMNNKDYGSLDDQIDGLEEIAQRIKERKSKNSNRSVREAILAEKERNIKEDVEDKEFLASGKKDHKLTENGNHIRLKKLAEEIDNDSEMSESQKAKYKAMLGEDSEDDDKEDDDKKIKELKEKEKKLAEEVNNHKLQLSELSEKQNKLLEQMSKLCFAVIDIAATKKGE